MASSGGCGPALARIQGRSSWAEISGPDGTTGAKASLEAQSPSHSYDGAEGHVESKGNWVDCSHTQPVGWVLGPLSKTAISTFLISWHIS